MRSSPIEPSNSQEANLEANPPYTRTITSTVLNPPTTPSPRRCTSAAAEALHHDLHPSVQRLKEALDEKAKAWSDIVKIGRTHLMDAVPLTLGQEVSGWAAQLDANLDRIESALADLYELALGGTAVGTGLNTHPDYASNVAEIIAEITGLPFETAPNLFARDRGP